MPKSSTFANSEQVNLLFVCSIATVLIINFAIRNATIHRHFDKKYFAKNFQRKFEKNIFDRKKFEMNTDVNAVKKIMRSRSGIFAGGN